MHLKAFVARRGFALSSCQGIFFARCGVQKNREVFAHCGVAQLGHFFWRAPNHHPVFVFDGLV